MRSVVRENSAGKEIPNPSKLIAKGRTVKNCLVFMPIFPTTLIIMTALFLSTVERFVDQF